MALHPVSRQYNKKGGLEFYLLKEHLCRLVINVKLTNHENQSWRHFFAWNGRVFHDGMEYCTVSRNDRTREGCKAPFKKLFPKEQFASYQICNVFELRLD